MEEKQGPHRFGGFEQGQKLGFVPGFAIDHHVELRAFKAQHFNRPLQFLDGGIHVLEGQSRQPGEPAGMLLGHPGDLVVNVFGHLNGRTFFPMVGE